MNNLLPTPPKTEVPSSQTSSAEHIKFNQGEEKEQPFDEEAENQELQAMARQKIQLNTNLITQNFQKVVDSGNYEKRVDIAFHRMTKELREQEEKKQE